MEDKLFNITDDIIDECLDESLERVQTNKEKTSPVNVTI